MFQERPDGCDNVGFQRAEDREATLIPQHVYRLGETASAEAGVPDQPRHDLGL